MQAGAKMEREELLLGVDVGGTFTDAAVVANGRLVTGKVPTTGDDQSKGVLAAIEQALGRAGGAAQDVTRFAHGMTVGTNALLEERGARTALIATEGFTDVIEIARQNRPELYQLCRGRPAPLVPEALRFGLEERMGPDGVVVPMGERSLEEVLERVAAADVEAVAISLLHSFAHPEHERQVAAALADRLPAAHVSASYEVLRMFREYERTSTTVIDAYLSPLLCRYLERLVEEAAKAGLPEPEIMQSSGGVLSASATARHAAWTVLSGPAGGAVGAAYLGELAGASEVISFDMGGTSCDVSVVDGGKLRQTAQRTIEGRVLQLPMVDVHTVGAGGGSIAWIDAGGALRVGPLSVGADPGPASYGRGGTEASVTDANLLLGYLDGESSLAGSVRLDVEAARHAVGQLASRAGLGVEETASGITRVADQEMLRALRVVTVERGIDPRLYALVAFGGAGPMHTARIAEELGIDRVLCPRAAGVLSALGLLVSVRRRDLARSVLLSGAELEEHRVQPVVDALAEEALREVPDGRIEVAYDLRYRGQAFELRVEGVERPDPGALRERFEDAHRERYGYADPDAELELVNVRVAAIAAGAAPELSATGRSGDAAVRGSRDAIFEGKRMQATVVRGELSAGEEVEGPAICELPESTAVVPPGWAGRVRDEGTLVLERKR
jgi:N-methylhydantoinase A